MGAAVCLQRSLILPILYQVLMTLCPFYTSVFWKKITKCTVYKIRQIFGFFFSYKYTIYGMMSIPPVQWFILYITVAARSRKRGWIVFKYFKFLTCLKKYKKTHYRTLQGTFIIDSWWLSNFGICLSPTVWTFSHVRRARLSCHSFFHLHNFQERPKTG